MKRPKVPGGTTATELYWAIGEEPVVLIVTSLENAICGATVV